MDLSASLLNLSIHGDSYCLFQFVFVASTPMLGASTFGEQYPVLHCLVYYGFSVENKIEENTSDTMFQVLNLLYFLYVHTTFLRIWLKIIQ